MAVASGLKPCDALKPGFAATPDPSFAEIEMSLPVKLDETPDERENESSSSSDESDGSELKTVDNLKQAFAATSDPSFAEIEMSLPVKLDETPDVCEDESSSSSDESDGSDKRLKAFDIMKEAFVATPDGRLAENEMSLPVKRNEASDECEDESSSSSDESDGSDNGLTAFDTVKQAFVATPGLNLAEIEMSLPVKCDKIPNRHENESSSSSDESDGSENGLTAFDTVKEAFAVTPDPSFAEIDMSLPIELDETPNEREKDSSSSGDESDGSGSGLTAFGKLKQAFAVAPDRSLAEIEMSLPVKLDETADKRENESSSSSDESDGSDNVLTAFDTLKEAFTVTPDRSFAEIEMSLPVELDETPNAREDESSSSSNESDGSGSELTAFDILKETFVATPDPSLAEIEMSLPVKLDETPNERANESSSSSDESDGSGKRLIAFDTVKEAFTVTPDPSLAEIEMSLPVKLDQTPNAREDESSSSSDEFDGSGNELTAFDILKETFVATPDPSLAEIEMSLPVKLDETPNERANESSSSSDESDGSGKRLIAFDTVKEAFTVTPDPSLAEIEMSLPVKLDQTPNAREDESSSSSDEFDGSGNELTAFDILKETFVATPDPSLAEIEMSLPVKPDQIRKERANESSSSSDESDGGELETVDNLKQAFAETSGPSLAEIEMSLPVKLDQTSDACENESSSSSDESDGSGSGLKPCDTLKPGFAATSDPSFAEIEMSLPVKLDQTPDEHENESSSSSDESDGSDNVLTAFDTVKEAFAVTPDPSLAEIEMSLPVKFDQTLNERENESSSSSDESDGSGSGLTLFGNLKQAFAATPHGSLAEIEMSLPVKFDETPNERKNESSSSSDESEGSGSGLTAFANLKQAFAVTPDPSLAEIEMSLPAKLDQTPNELENESSSSSDESNSSAKRLRAFDIVNETFAVTPDPSLAEIEMSLPVKLDKTPNEREDDSSSSSDESDGSENGLTAFDTLKEAFAVTPDRSFVEIEMSLPVKLDQTPNAREDESSSSSDESDGSGNELTAFDILKETFVATPDPSLAEIEMSLPVKLDQTPNESSSSSDESDGSELKTVDNLKLAFAGTSDPSFAEIEMSLPVKLDQTSDACENESSLSSDESDGSGKRLRGFDFVKEAFVATPDPSFAEIEMSLPAKPHETSDERANESSSSSDESDGSGRGLTAFDILKEAFVAIPDPSLAEIEMSLPVKRDQTPDEPENKSSSSSDESDGSGSGLKPCDALKPGFAATSDPSLAEIEMSLPVKLDQTPDEPEDESSSSSDESDGSGSGLTAFDNLKEAFVATPDPSLAEIEMSLPAKLDQTPNERENESSSSSDESDGSGSGLTAFANLKQAFAVTPDPSLAEIEMSLPAKLDQTPNELENESSSSSDESNSSAKRLRAFDIVNETFAVTPDPSLVEIEMSLPVKLDQTPNEREDDSSSSSDESDGSENGLTAFDTLKEAFAVTPDRSFVEIEMSLPVKLDQTPNAREDESSSSSDESDGSGNELTAFDILKETFVATPDPSLAEIEMSLPVKLDQTPNESSSSSDESDGSELKTVDNLKLAFAGTSDPSFAEIEMSLPVKLDQTSDACENESSLSSDESDGSGKRLRGFDFVKEAFVATPDPSFAEIEMSLPAKPHETSDERANESSSSSDESDGSGRGLTAFDILKEAFVAIPDPSLAEIEMSLPVKRDQTPDEPENKSSSSSDESDGSGSGLKPCDALKPGFAATSDPSLAEIEMSLPVKLDQTPDEPEDESSSSSDESDGSGSGLTAFDNLKEAFVATPDPSLAEIEMSLPAKLDQTPNERENESSSSSDESDGSGSGLTAFANLKQAFAVTPDPSLAEIEMSLPAKLDQTPNELENESSSSSDESNSSAKRLRAFDIVNETFAVTPDPSLVEIEMSLPVKLDKTPNEREDDSSSSSDESDGSENGLTAFDTLKEAFAVTPDRSFVEIEMSLPVKLDQTPNAREDESSSSSDESDGSGNELTAFDILKETFVATPDPSLAEIEMSLPVKLDQTPNESSSSSDESDGSELKTVDNLKLAFAGTSDPSFAEIEMSLPVKLDQTSDACENESSSSSDESDGSGKRLRGFDFVKEAFVATPDPSFAEIEMSLPAKPHETSDERANESSSSSDESDGSGRGLTAFDILKEAFVAIPDPSLAEIEMSLPVKRDQTPDEPENKSSSSSDESDGSGSGLKPCDALKPGFAATSDPSLAEIEMSLPVKLDQTPDEPEDESSSSSDESDGSGSGLTAFDNLKEAFVATPDPSLAEIEMSLPAKLDQTPNERENESSSSSDESDGSGSGLKAFGNLKPGFAVTPDPSFAETEMSLPVKLDLTPDDHKDESSSSSDESDGSGKRLRAFDTVKEGFTVTPNPSVAEIEMSLSVKRDETPNEQENESSSSSDESDGSGSGLKAFGNLKPGFAVTPDPSFAEIEMSLPVKLDETPNKHEDESSSSSDESDGSGKRLREFDFVKEGFTVTPNPSLAEIEMSLSVKRDETPNEQENESSSSSDESDGSGKRLRAFDFVKEGFTVSPNPSLAEIEMSLPVKLDETSNKHEDESSSSSDESDGSAKRLRAFDTTKGAFVAELDRRLAEIEMSLPVKLDETPDERENESSSSSDESDGSELKTVDNSKQLIIRNKHLLQRRIQVLLSLRCHCQLNLMKLQMYVKTIAAQAVMILMAVTNG